MNKTETKSQLKQAIEELTESGGSIMVFDKNSKVDVVNTMKLLTLILAAAEK